MKRISKDDYYLGIAKAVSKRSTCLRRHYGCVIVKNDEIISTGYNGSPRGEDNCCDIFVRCPRENEKHNSGNYGTCKAVHAEQNALLSAKRQDLIGAVLYLFCEEFVEKENVFTGEKFCIWADKKEGVEPCPICLRMIQNSGIKKVITEGDRNGNN